jgi:hypothetical protein
VFFDKLQIVNHYYKYLTKIVSMKSNRQLLTVIALFCSLFSTAQTTNIYTSATTWTVPPGVWSVTVKMYGGGGGTGGQDCGAGCSNPAAGNAGFLLASFPVAPNNTVGIYPGGQGQNGSNSVTASGGGTGGVATYNTTYNGGKGGNAGPSGSSGGGGGGGAASVFTVNAVIKMVAGGASGGGGMANLAGSGSPGTNTYTANGTSNTGGVGTTPAGDGGGGGGGGGGSFGSLGGGTHAANTEQAGNGGGIGNNLVSGASTVTTNGNIVWTSGGRIEITYTVLLPVVWLDFTALRQNDGSVLLNWSTASELHTKSFTVQRSNSGADWTDIGSVAAAGNSITTVDYRFADRNVPNGVYYYRLAQIDLDGKINYSKVVVSSSAGSVSRFYPNPVLNGTASLNLTRSSVITIYNSRGAVMQTKKLPAGDNKLDLSKYAAGVYFLRAGEQKITFVIK